MQRGDGYRGERGAWRASASVLAGLPASLVVPDQQAPEASDPTAGPGRRAGGAGAPTAGTAERGGWSGAPTAGAPGRGPAGVARSASGGVLPSASAPTSRGSSRAPGGSAPVGLALRRALQRDPEALARALGSGFGFGRIEDLALPPGIDREQPAGSESAPVAASRAHIGAPVVRQASSQVPASGALPQRASRRGNTRSHRGPRVSQRTIARLAELSGSEGIAGLDEGTLASAAGLVDRAVRRQATRSGQHAERSAHITPMMALPEAEFRSILREEMAELTTIAAPAPTVHREILEAAARIEEASKVQRAPSGPKGPGAGGKKDLEDFLRRAIRQIGVREDIERSRDLTPWD